MTKIIQIVLISAFLVSCATYKARKEVRKKVESVEEAEILRNEMGTKLKTILENSEKVSVEDRIKALDSYNQTLEKIDSLNLELKKNKIVLFRHLANDKYDATKVKVLRKNMKKIYREKFNVMFDGILALKDILGIEYKKTQDQMSATEIDFFYPDSRR